MVDNNNSESVAKFVLYNFLVKKDFIKPNQSTLKGTILQ